MKARRAGQATKNMSAQAQRAGSEMKAKAKSGLKGMIKKGAMKVACGAVNVAKRMSEAKLDPVGKEDGDVNNDGKKDSTDSYLMNRRKAIGKAMGKKMKKEEVEPVDEAMAPGPRREKMRAKMHDPYVRGCLLYTSDAADE